MTRLGGTTWPFIFADDEDDIIGLRSPNGVDKFFTFEGGGGTTVAWGDVTDKPAVIAAGATQAAARTAIGAGTSSLALGTTASTAAAGNHTHTFTALTGTVAGATGANLQAILNDLAARIGVLEA